MDELRRITTRLNIEGVTLHTFRHTVITLLQESGLPLKAAQNLVAHETHRLRHGVPEHQSRVAEAMGRTPAGMQLQMSDTILTENDATWNTSGGRAGGRDGSQTA